jgi:hypothetical protein
MVAMASGLTHAAMIFWTVVGQERTYLRHLVVIVFATLLVGCDTLHGVTFDIGAENGRAFSDSCIESGIQSVGLDAKKTSPTQFVVSNAADNSGYIFFVSTIAKQGGANVYELGLGAPMSCEAFRQVAPRMNEAAAAIQRSCMINAQPIKITLVGRQQSCGVKFH